MNQQDVYFLELLRSGAYGTPAPPMEAPVNYIHILRQAQIHRVVPIVYAGIARLLRQDADRNAIDAFKQLSIRTTCSQYVAIKELSRVMDEFRKSSIDVVVFKGVVLADLYPNHAYRHSCDVDMLARKQDYAAAKNLLESLGYTLDKKASKDSVKNFRSPLLTIDFHMKLWGDIRSRFIQVAEEIDMLSDEKIIEINACGVNVRTLGYEEHFIFLLIHMAKHFIVKGAGIRHMLDMSLFYNRHRQHFDMDRAWEKIRMMGFYTLYQYIFSICIRYLGMDASILKDREIALNPEHMESLLADILEGGVFGGDPERSLSQNVAKESYYAGVVNGSQMRVALHMLFPHAVGLPAKYNYAKRHPLLLPAAWIHRLFNFFWNRLFGDGRANIFDSVSLADRRVKLLSNMRLEDK